MRNKPLQYSLILLTNCFLSFNAVCAEYVKSSQMDFAHPHDLVLDPQGKYLLVSDMRNDVIRVLDPLSLKTIAKIGEGKLSAPHDVSFDSLGRLLVADSGNNRIVIFQYNAGSATLLSQLSENMRSPEGVCADEKGNIFVTSAGTHYVLKFTGDKLVKQMGGRGSSNAQFIRPHDIDTGPDGLLYIADPGNNRIQVLSNSLEYIETIQPKTKPLNEPKYIALDGRGNLFIADQYNSQLRIFNAQNNEIHTISKANGTTLNKIEGVEYQNGKLWISDTYNNRIVLFNWNP